MNKIPLYSDEEHELLGLLVEDNNSWIAQTVFGYVIERTTSRKAAEAVLRQQGLRYLSGVWQYFDSDEQDWFPCILKDITENRVTIIRTDSMGSEDPATYKMVTLLHPTENTLIKSH